MNQETLLLQKAINDAHFIVALTGAGISTSAGIPDFRGKKGIYETGAYDPYKTFEFNYFVKDPSFFFNFARDFAGLYKEIKPTEGHKFLARLEEKGKLKTVITQNIDGLHQMAGSKKVIEVHGSFTRGHCLDCWKKYDFEWMKEKLNSTGELKCKCEGLVKPDIVFFGEPVVGLDEASSYIRKADLLIVLGSSLSVQPASLLPYLSPGKVIIINMGKAYYSSENLYLKINSDIDSVVSELII